MKFFLAAIVTAALLAEIIPVWAAAPGNDKIENTAPSVHTETDNSNGQPHAGISITPQTQAQRLANATAKAQQPGAKTQADTAVKDTPSADADIKTPPADMQPEPPKPVIKKIKPPVPAEKPLRVIWPQDFYYYSYNGDPYYSLSLPKDFGTDTLVGLPAAGPMLMRAQSNTVLMTFAATENDPAKNRIFSEALRDIRERTDAAIEALQLSRLKDRAVDVLSSGEKQRAAIASVYAMKPKVFVCDEPTANLDAAGTRQLAQTLRQLKEQGFTLLIAEHRIDWLMGIADRFLYLRDGRIAAEYTPEDLLLLPEADILGMGLRSPRKGMSLPAPSVLDESSAVLKTAGLSKRIRKEVIFEDISLSVPEGGVTAITGQNGAGKTTLAQILCGLTKQTRGHILIDGKKAPYYCYNYKYHQFI